MNKVLAVLIAGLFAAGAYAQTKPSELDPTAQGKPAAAAEAKVNARPAGQVQPMGGDMAKTPEGSGGVTTGKAAVAAEKREATRDARRRNKDGSVKRKSMQGGTPK
ncbi:cell envelope biogenesis protein TolA [Variovorax sp. PAMC 28711]|uniref:cell envelope biogenesis protein TolA n=1 Tax=Variovorax sp. PAMC 28711 TaxID=1795631 RepID=UPI00078EB63A|nr:cell envelope biogenesis protein TolA [Variovorax sp. PAMC 28711]AMM26215.1 cell envelope biogenesis protein TolA [Variovorax sp. PAMC 28711]